MTIKKSVIPILYHGGTYGTYLHWVLDTLMHNGTIESPFTELGTSHKFQGIEVADVLTWWDYIDNCTTEQFVRLHPKSLATESLITNLDKILETVEQAVYIAPSESLTVLTLNNCVFKVWGQPDSWWDYETQTTINLDQIYANWPVTPGTPIKDIPIWIKREFMSHYLMHSWQDQIEQDKMQHWHHSSCLTISVNDILFDIVNTIERIQSFCHLKFVRSIQDIIPYHAQMIRLQKYLGHDQICDNIVNSVITNLDYDWSSTDLSLVDEVWIQWRLRQLGYEIECHGLDKFPTNSVTLQERTYKL